MRNLMLVFAGLAVMAGIVSANLWRELRLEREMTAGLRAQLAQAATPSFTPGSSMPARAPAPAPATSTADAASAAKPRTELPPAAVPLPGLINSRELMNDPDYRKARLAQTRLSLPQNYPGLIEELGLSREEADQLFDLLAEDQVSLSSQMPISTNGQIDPSAMQEYTRARQEQQAKLNESIASLLGSRYGQWQEYQQTRPARTQVTQVGRTLESMGMPITTAQQRPLTAVYIAEQKRMMQERQSMVSNMGNIARDPQSQARLQEESMKLQTESNRRILEAAAAHLSAEQVEALRLNFEQQMAMSRATSRMLNAQREAQAQAQSQGQAVQGQAPAGAVVINSAVTNF
jgi:hypothetical protein